MKTQQKALSNNQINIQHKKTENYLKHHYIYQFITQHLDSKRTCPRQLFGYEMHGPTFNNQFTGRDSNELRSVVFFSTKIPNSRPRSSQYNCNHNNNNNNHNNNNNNNNNDDDDIFYVNKITVNSICYLDLVCE